MNTLRIFAPLVLCLSPILSYTIETSTPTTTLDCADYTGTYAPCYRHDLDCCTASELCEWDGAETCATDNYVNRGCCQRISKATTTSAPSTTTSTTSTSTSTTSTSSTSEGSYPTPRPTMKSALKWDMIHPQYKGSDGELLWHVYYGDFSDDERFDGFRDNELWDADVIRPILQNDAKFASYAELNNKRNNVMARESHIPTAAKPMWYTDYVVWVVLFGVALAVALALYKRDGSELYNKLEAKALVSHAEENECYVH